MYHTLSPLKPKDIGTDVDQGHLEDEAMDVGLQALSQRHGQTIVYLIFEFFLPRKLLSLVVECMELDEPRYHGLHATLGSSGRLVSKSTELALQVSLCQRMWLFHCDGSTVHVVHDLQVVSLLRVDDTGLVEAITRVWHQLVRQGVISQSRVEGAVAGAEKSPVAGEIAQEDERLWEGFVHKCLDVRISWRDGGRNRALLLVRAAAHPIELLVPRHLLALVSATDAQQIRPVELLGGCEGVSVGLFHLALRDRKRRALERLYHLAIRLGNEIGCVPEHVL